MAYENINVPIGGLPKSLKFYKRLDNSFVSVHEMAYERAAEQRSEADLENGEVIFDLAIEAIEIYNRSPQDALFRVNGINFIVPALTTWSRPIGGTPSTTVQITGSSSFLITRLI